MANKTVPKTSKPPSKKSSSKSSSRVKLVDDKPSKPAEKDLAELFADDGGSNTFQLFMRMNQFKKKGIEDSEMDDVRMIDLCYLIVIE